MSWRVMIELLPWLAAGVILGAAYMHLIARSVAAIETPAAYPFAAVWLILRIGLAGAVLALAAMQGVGPTLAVLAGFLLARTVAIRRVLGD